MSLATGRHYRDAELCVKDDLAETYTEPDFSLMRGQARRR
jgi:hypothetical protein